MRYILTLDTPSGTGTAHREAELGMMVKCDGPYLCSGSGQLGASVPAPSHCITTSDGGTAWEQSEQSKKLGWEFVCLNPELAMTGCGECAPLA